MKSKIDKGGLPCWSPDASQIAFKDDKYYLCIHNLKTGETTRLFNSEGMLLLPGCWSSDGKYVLITIMDRQSRKSTLWKISSDGKERKQITGHHENIYRYLALSPDGTLLVYAALEGKYLGFYIMLSEGGVSLPFAISTDGHNEAPVWSPDGKKIAYSSSRDWNVDVFTMDVDIESFRTKLEIHNR